MENTPLENKSPDQSENVITLNDLVMCRNIIYIASKRGAFSAEEFTDIGGVYNKLDTFLKKHVKTTDGKSSTESSEKTTDENNIEI